MPKGLMKCIREVMREGIPKKNAWPICVNAMKKAGKPYKKPKSEKRGAVK